MTSWELKANVALLWSGGVDLRAAFSTRDHGPIRGLRVGSTVRSEPWLRITDRILQLSEPARPVTRAVIRGLVRPVRSTVPEGGCQDFQGSSQHDWTLGEAVEGAQEPGTEEKPGPAAQARSRARDHNFGLLEDERNGD